MTPLQYSCQNGNKEISELLINLGANLNWKDNKGNTCLHYAVNSENPSLVKKLIMFGANKYIKNEEGNSPLDLAEKNKNNEIIDMLKEKNCSFIMKFYNKEKKGINSLKNNGNNFLIFFLIFTLIPIFKWLFLLKIYYIYQNMNKYDIIPFIYDINQIRTICHNVFPEKEYNECKINNETIQMYIQNTNDTKSIISNIKEIFKEDTLGYDSLETLYIIRWVFSLLDIFILLIILKFLFFPKNIYIKKNEISKATTMIKLFEENMNFCPKCRIIKENKTVHCIICDRCVKDFHHHCDVLNICICGENISLFKKLLYSILINLIYNSLHYFFSK